MELSKSWLFLVLFSVIIPSVHAKDTDIQLLERKLQERDKVILELLERVEALERRNGVQRASTEVETVSAEIVAEASVSIRPPKQSPGAVVVSEEDAERALERSLTQDGAVLLRQGAFEIEPSLTYTRSEDSTPGLVAFDGNLFTGEIERNANNIAADLAMRWGLPWESQLEIGIPYRWRDIDTVTSIGFVPTSSTDQSGSGLGDFRVGLAKTLLREGLWRPDLVGRLTWDTATGEELDNNISLGGGFHELQASLTAIKRQDPIAFVGGLSYGYTFKNGQIQPAPIVGANFGSYVALSPETSLRFLLSAAYQGETTLSGRAIAGSDRTIGSLVIGGSTLIAPGTLLNLSAGIGLTDDADDFSLSLSLPIRSN